MNTKGTWWSVTAYNDEIGLLETPTSFPDFVEKVLGGREECPTTHRLHFQGAVKCRRQVRLTQLKKWLPTAHFEIARNAASIQKYAMKKETAVGDKVARSNPTELITVEKVMMKIAEYWESDTFEKFTTVYEDDLDKAVRQCYWYTVRQLLEWSPEYRKVCHLFARSDVITLWQNTRIVWLKLAESEVNSITPSPSENDGVVVAPVKNDFPPFSTEWSGSVNEVVLQSEV